MAPATESLPRRNSDPIWLQDYFVHTGHDVNTRNGTATFVKRRGRYYVCTCRHIMQSIRDPKVVPNAKFPMLALVVDNEVINLARMTATGPELVMRAPGPETDHAETDIAIAPLDAETWHCLATKKNKSAIDLDCWREPNWSTIRFGVACGYPDEHKKDVSANSIDQVANQLITVVAELASTPSSASRTITLNSTLADPHTWYFSGLSGGPLYFVEGLEERQAEDDELFPVGIVFQGYPSSGRSEATESRDATAAFLTNKDLFIRALALSPAIFDEWLRDCGFAAAASSASGTTAQPGARGSGQQHGPHGSGHAPASGFLTPDLDEFWGHQVAEKAKPKVLQYFALATLIVAVLSFLYGKEIIDSTVKSEIKSVIDSKSSEVDKQIDELMKPQLARIDALKKQADDLAGEIEQLKKNTETQVSQFSTLIIGSEQQIRQYLTSHQTEISARPPIVDLSNTIGEIIDSGDSSSGEGVAPIYAIQSMLAKFAQPTKLSYAGVFYSAGGTNFGVAPDSMFTVLKNLGAYTAADWPRGIKTKPANISPVVTITGFNSRNVFTKNDVIEELKRGKVVVAIFNMDAVLLGYTAGVFKVPGQSQNANHAIAVVGYDDNTSSFKVANSWGSHWGEAGFARIDTDAFVSRTLQLFVIDDLQIAAH